MGQKSFGYRGMRFWKNLVDEAKERSSLSKEFFAKEQNNIFDLGSFSQSLRLNRQELLSSFFFIFLFSYIFFTLRKV